MEPIDRGIERPQAHKSVAPAGKDWRAWHEPYQDEASPLSRRLRIIQSCMDAWLDERAGEALTIASACAGEGRDLLGVLVRRDDSGRVRAVLVENDEQIASRAEAAARAAGLNDVIVRVADAGDPTSYEGLVPADLVLMVGVFGNISDAGVQRTIAALPSFCSNGGVVIWTRSRREPDLTPMIRRWLQESGFAESAFHAPDDVLFSVGVHRLTADPAPALGPDHGRLFQFLV